jgi:hypothetical protein
MKVKIGHLEYVVEAMHPEKADAERADGLCAPRLQKIFIRSDLPAAQQAGILIHELIHAIFHAHGLPDHRLTEEDVATRLEGPLASLIRDNPTLMQNLLKGLTGARPIVSVTVRNSKKSAL